MQVLVPKSYQHVYQQQVRISVDSVGLKPDKMTG
jgi:hypothetical protein